MTPADLGLPPKFATWRKGQDQLVLDVGASSKRFSLVSAPPGAGKSGIVMALHSLVGGRTLVLTRTKGLQEQYSRDFQPMGLVDIRGLGNYDCVAVEPGGELEEFANPMGTTSCADAPCRVRIECSLRKGGGCHYYDAVREAAEAPVVIGNYSHWMALNRYAEPGTLGRFDLLILDEAHQAPDILADFCTIELEKTKVHRFYQLPMPDPSDDLATWAEWAGAAHRAAQNAWRTVKAELDITRGPGRRKLARELKELTEIGSNLAEIAGASKWRRTDAPATDVVIPGAQTDWVIQALTRRDGTKIGARFSPVWGHAYAEHYLFGGIKRVVLTSATLQKRTARDLGIPEDRHDYHESQSAFHSARRRLYWVPTTRIDAKMTEGQRRLWVNRIDEIIDKRRDRAGIIHARSFARAQEIIERSRNRDIMITHTTSTTGDVVEHYKQKAREGRGIVLVSPSMSEGYDFPGPECRYQILAKVPFVDSRDPITAARSRADKTYVNSVAAREVVQQVGRGTRADDDWCENFILDDHWAWFWPACKRLSLFARWFEAGYLKLDKVPDPPALGTGPKVVTMDDYRAVTGVRRKARP